MPDLTAFDLDNDNVRDAISTLDENGVTAWVNADGHPGWDLVFRDFNLDGAVNATMADLDQDRFREAPARRRHRVHARPGDRHGGVGRGAERACP